MWPFVYVERARSIDTITAFCIPTCTEGAIGIGVTHKGAPSASLLIPVDERVWFHPKFDSTLGIGILEDIRNCETCLLEIYCYILFLASHRRDGRNHRSFMASFVNSSHAIATCFGDRIRKFLCGATKFVIDKNLVFLDFVTIGLRCWPSEFSIADGGIGGSKELFAIDNGAISGNGAFLDVYTSIFSLTFQFERGFDTALVKFVVEDARIIEMSWTFGSASNARFCFAVDDEEVLQRTWTVETCAQIGEVVTKLHGFGVQLTVCPTSQHGYFGQFLLVILSCAGVTSATITRPAEVVEVDNGIRTSGIEIGRNTNLQEKFRTTRIVHLHLNGAERTIVFAHVVDFGFPKTTALAAHTLRVCFSMCWESISIGAINETIVWPKSPWVGNNPSAYFIFVFFTRFSVAIEVKFDAIVITHERKGVIDCRAPVFHIVHTHYTSGLVGRCVRDAILYYSSSNANTSNATCLEVGVAIVVPQPVFHLLAAFLCSQIIRNVGRLIHTVVHGFKPFVVTSHPTEVLVGFFSITK